MFFSEYQFKNTEYLDNVYDEKFSLLYLKRSAVSDLLFDWDTEYTHQPLASIEYAERLLAEGTPERIARAEDILSVCVDLQYKILGQDNFGLFPYHSETYNKFIEISIRSNTISFKIGVRFLLILKNHTDKLNKSLIKDIENSAYNLLFRLSTFDKIDHNGTFVHSIQTYLFFLGGEYFNNADFFNCGVSNFLNFYSSIIYHKNYHEYNSFYELSIISEILSDIKKILIDSNLLSKLDEIYNILWKTISQNFHSNFHILAGPQSDISRHAPHEYFLYFLSKATGIEFDYGNITYKPEIISVCPEKYLYTFSGPVREKFILSTVSKGISVHSFMLSRIASCYLHPDYSLGSFNHENFFFANIPFIGYFRSDEQYNPYSFTIEMLNNNTPVCLSVLHSVQFKNSVLGAITFSVNHGAYHHKHSLPPGLISVNDFKLRFKISGDISKLDIVTHDKELIARYSDIYLRFQIPYALISGIPIDFELSHDENNVYYDVVIGKNMEFDLDFSKINEAILQFLFTIKKGSNDFNNCKCYVTDSNLVAEFNTGECHLKTVTPYKPDSFEFTSANDTQSIDNLNLHQYVDFTDSKARQYKFIADSVSGIQLPNFENNRSFVTELSELECQPINLIGTKVNHLLRILDRQNFSVDVFKRYSVHIITAAFDRIKHENVQLEQTINHNYSDIYRQISYLSDKKRIIDLILSIINELQKNCIEIQSQPKNKSLIEDIIKILENKYSDTSLSLTALSDMTGFSEPYISKQFKAVTGMNYMKYLSKLRIEKAKAFLGEGYSPEETSQKCGFTNMHTFNRVFKEYAGVTSGKWKNKL